MHAGNKRAGFNRGQWEVQRERLQVPDACPRPPLRDASPIADILARVTTQLDLGDPAAVSSLEEHWPDIVGKDISAHTRPGPLRDLRLTVYVDSAVWLNELRRYAKGKLLQKIREHVGANHVREILLAPDPDGGHR